MKAPVFYILFISRSWLNTNKPRLVPKNTDIIFTHTQEELVKVDDSMNNLIEALADNLTNSELEIPGPEDELESLSDGWTTFLTDVSVLLFLFQIFFESLLFIQ